MIFTKEMTGPSGSGEDPMRINFKLHGRILDGKSLDPLPFASVSEASEMTGTLTNEEGYFTLNNVSSDTTAIRVNYLGYKKLELKLIPSQIEELNVIYLFPDKGILPVATIQAKQNASIETTSSPGVYAIDMNTISQLGNTGERDVIRALQLLPAVSGTTENSSEVHVRGGASDENLFLFDGFTIYHTDHFFGIFSAFNADAVKHVQLRKGTLQPRFGGRTASVIEINGKNGNLLKPITKVNLSLMSASVLVESPIVAEKSSVLLAFRRSYSDVVFSPLYQSMFNNLYNRSLSSSSNNEVDAFSSNAPQFYFYDANVKFSFKASNKDQLHFSLYAGRDQLNIGYEDLTTDDRLSVQYNDESRWGNIGVSGKWNKQWDPDQATQAVLGFSSFNSDLFGFDVRKNLFIGITDSIFFDQNNVLQDLSLKLDHQVQVENHQLGFGLNFTNYFIDSQSFNRDGTENQTLSDEELTAFYMQDDVEFNDHWSLMAGLRWSLFSGTKTSYMEPRALLVYTPSEAFQLHAGGSRNNQFIRRIRRQNLFLNTPDSWALSSLEGVPVLQAEQISAGVKFNFKQFNVEVNAYYVEKDGTLQDVQALDGIPNGTYQNDLIIGSGLSQGVEVLLKKDLGIHSGWLSYTLSQTENSFLDGPFNDLPADFDQLHELSVVYLFRYKRWKSSLAWVYGSGKPFTKALG
ncbi:MAG: TonB-dependent receptor, partial [Flavobacteriales bacterium]